MASKGTLESQVAGHKGGIQVSGSLLIKTTSQREVDFYDALAPSLCPGLVGEWTPRFMGTLALKGQLEPNAPTLDVQHIKPVAGQDGKSVRLGILLENLTYYFSQPCVMDFKLGKQLWDEAAPQAKREKMTKDAIGTTIESKGLRLTGCRIYNPDRQDYDATAKEYGKTITEAQLGEAVQRCFPSLLPRPLLASVLTLVLTHLRAYQKRVQAIEWRLRGSSILVVYEGDPSKLQEALEQDYAADNAIPVVVEDDDDDSDDSGHSLGDDPNAFQPAVLVKAVDFAHAWDYTGQGPDQGYNQGLDNLIGLVEARLKEVQTGA